jgi:DNA-binding NarL/FixJ family response regulator
MKTIDSPIKIIIVDDHRLFNDGLDAMLSSQESIEVLAQIYDSREAEQKILELKPDVVLIDFNMPFMNGIELTKLLLGKIPDIKILILSMYNEEMYIENFRRSGSKGYLFKTASVEEVVKAIGDVNAGLQHFPLTTKKSNHSEDMFLKRLKLSDREVEVIRLVKAGLKTKEIADKLNISFYTAETHRKNIKLKIGIEGEAAFLKFIYSNDFEGGQSIKSS